jgi:hypothetical protein
MKKFIWIAIAVLVAGAIFPFVLAGHERRLAQSVVGELDTIAVGTADIRVVRDLLDKCGAACSQSQQCNEQLCEVTFKFENSPLWELRLAPFTHLGGSIALRNNVVDYAALVYRVNCGRRQLSSGISIEQFPASPAELPFQVSVGPVEGKPPTVFVRMTSAVSPNQKASVFALNFSCLSRIGGCSGVSELAPALETRKPLVCQDKG